MNIVAAVLYHYLQVSYHVFNVRIKVTITHL